MVNAQCLQKVWVKLKKSNLKWFSTGIESPQYETRWIAGLKIIRSKRIYHDDRIATAAKKQKEKDLETWKNEFETIKDQITGKHEVAVKLIEKDILKQRKKLDFETDKDLIKQKKTAGESMKAIERRIERNTDLDSYGD